MGKISDIAGRRFGRLLVLSRHGTSPDRHITWLCRCDCGSQKVISGNSIRSGLTTSCGCYLNEVIKRGDNKSSTHGMTSTGTYRSWNSMLNRCLNTQAPDYERYGGRGISVCQEWLVFEKFHADMGDRPIGMTIDRKDVNGNYTAKNCKWSDRKDQQRNRRSNVLLSFQGQVKCAAEWAEITGLTVKVIYDRTRAGWSAEKTLTQKVAPRKPRIQ